MQCARANGFEQGTCVHEIVRVSVGFCAVRALKSFVQCASAVSSCPCSVLVWDQYDSWAGACANEVMCESVRFVLMCGSVYREGLMYRVSTPVRCSPTQALYNVLLCSRGSVCR